MNSVANADPFHILGLQAGAGENEVRARYLELVKQHPPERDPEKFREIRAAFDACKDPLAIARRLLQPPGGETPRWSRVIDAETHNPPRLTPTFLLSLGNRDADEASETKDGDQD